MAASPRPAGSTGHTLVFFAGGDRKDEPGGLPIWDHLACLEVERPEP